MREKSAKIVSVIFHPVLIPTLGLLLMFNSGFYFSMLTWEAKRFLFLIVFFTTAILPMLSVAILALSPKFDFAMTNKRDRIIPLLSTAFFYYIGYQLLSRVRIFPVFKLYFLASILVILMLLIISFKWKISLHMAAIGGLTATLFAFSFRSGVNPIIPIFAVVLISGMVGTARLILNKHNLLQIAAGYTLGFIILYIVIYFI